MATDVVPVDTAADTAAIDDVVAALLLCAVADVDVDAAVAIATAGQRSAAGDTGIGIPDGLDKNDTGLGGLRQRSYIEHTFGRRRGYVGQTLEHPDVAVVGYSWKEACTK